MLSGKGEYILQIKGLIQFCTNKPFFIVRPITPTSTTEFTINVKISA